MDEGKQELFNQITELKDSLVGMTEERDRWKEARYLSQGFYEDVVSERDKLREWKHIADGLMAASEKDQHDLARARERLRAVIDCGHNDDCLFCGRKDFIATQALAAGKRE